jgi:hypothetical protein
MTGGLTLAITGFYAALRRVWSDIVRVVRIASRRTSAPHPATLQSKSGDRWRRRSFRIWRFSRRVLREK